MASFLGIFTMRNLLVLSLALNLSLVLRVVYEGGKDGGPHGFSVEEQRVPSMADMGFGKEAQATQRTRLSVSSSSDQDVMEKVINLDHKAAKVGVPDVHVFYGNSYPKCMLARGTTWGCLLAFWEVQKRLKCAVGCLRSVKLLAAQVVNLLFMAFHFSPHIKIVWILPPSGTHKRFNPSE